MLPGSHVTRVNKLDSIITWIDGIDMSQIKSFLPSVLSLTHTLFPPFPLSPLSLFPHPVAPTFPTPFSPCSKVSDFQNQPYKIHFFLLSAQVFNSHSFSPSPSFLGCVCQVVSMRSCLMMQCTWPNTWDYASAQVGRETHTHT